MSSQPMFELPDFEMTTQGQFTTTVEQRFIVGRCVLDAGESLLISIDGGSFAEDTSMVLYEESTGRFVIPNPNVFPDGYTLNRGQNTFQLRKATSSNTQGAISSLKVRLVDDSDITFSPEPPTGIRAESYDGYVCIKWTNDSLDTENIKGYNLYCSTASGGGVDGYQRVNLYLLDTPMMERNEADFAEMEADIAIATDVEGNPAADPMFAEFTMVQRGLDGETIRTSINELLEIPETMSDIHVAIKVSSFDNREWYSFEHYRGNGSLSTPATIANSTFAITRDIVSLYYVATAVYVDPITKVETESPLSVEVAAHPMNITPEVGNFPVVGRNSLLEDTVASIYRINPEIAIHPGSVIRDVVLDPFLNEASRLRLIMDFLHRASSFSSLLEIDDPSRIGESTPNTSYKLALRRAFFLSYDYEVQAIIDSCFDKLASNVGVVRSQGNTARGEVTFYLTSRPTNSVVLPLGTQVAGGGVSFRTTVGATISLENLASFYDPVSRRYSVTVPAIANTPGVNGNIALGELSTTEVLDVFVTNRAAFFGGTNQESNAQLALRAQNTIASVDSGTLRGYLKQTASVPGVEEAQIVSADDIFMLRDYDEHAGRNIGGCVDIWIRGNQFASVTDTFAFTYEIKTGVQFLLADSPSALIFRAVDENLNIENPIIEMLSTENPKLGFRNVSTGEYFDLTNVEILAPNLIRLDTSIDQPSVDYGDVLQGDYRYRTGTEFVLTRQPVGMINQVYGTITGPLPSSLYKLHRPSSPFMLGNSTKASESLIIRTDLINADTPSGSQIEVTDEVHVVVGEFIEYVDNLGAIGLTVTVKSADGLITYRGPYDPSGEMDYTIQEGDQTKPLGIKRVLSGDIEDGEEVLISYTHDENFVVEYTTNLIVSTVQSDIDSMKHLTANVLAKQAMAIFVNITATILTQRGMNTSFVDSQVRTNLQALFASLTMGTPIRQSDVIEVIDSTEGVSYVIVPLTTMALADGSHIIREQITTDQISDFENITTWSNKHNNVFLIREPLNHHTTDGGGEDYGRYRAVFKDNDEMTIIDNLPYLIGQTECQAYIIGKEGLPIPGVSDDITLQGLGYVEEADIQAKRQELTQNRILVSLPVGDSPSQYKWSVTYSVEGNEDAKDLEISDISYFMMGDVVLSFDEDRPSTRRIQTSQSTSRY